MCAFCFLPVQGKKSDRYLARKYNAAAKTVRQRTATVTGILLSFFMQNHHPLSPSFDRRNLCLHVRAAMPVDDLLVGEGARAVSTTYCMPI